jgi:hypothetical protein
MKQTTALVASATILATGLASAGGATFAADHGTHTLASATPHQVKYTLPATSGVHHAVFRFPGLAHQIYNANFSIIASMSKPAATINCHFVRPDNTYQILQYGSRFSSFSTVSASGALDLRHRTPIRFRCFASDGTFTILTASQKSSVTFVQMGTTAVRSASVAPKSAAESVGRSATGG